jgi:hypothetical protein
VVAETRTLPSDVLGNGRSLKAVKAGGRIGASVAPCRCIPRQQHDARAVGFCRHKLRPPAAAGCGDLVQYASGQCPPSRGHDGKWITKDRATRVPRPVTARVIVMSFDLRVAVKGVAPSSRLGWQFNPIRARFGRSSVKDPNWSHPGKSTSYPRRSRWTRGNEGAQSFCKVLEVLGETPVASEPGKSALDHPTAR